MAWEAVQIARSANDDDVLADALRVYLIAMWGSHDADTAAESPGALSIAQRTGDRACTFPAWRYENAFAWSSVTLAASKHS